MTSPLRIGYLVPKFPSQTHAFFWREAGAMRAAGDEIVFMATARPPKADCPHDFAAQARAGTHYAYPPGREALWYLLRRLHRLPAVAGYLWSLRETGLKGRLRLAAATPLAAQLLSVCAARNLPHVHIHSCADAAHLGAMMARLGGISYSLTLHGDLDVYGRDHFAKMSNAALVTVVTHPLQAQVRGVLGADAHVPVITMGVDTERFRPLPGRAARAAEAPLDLVTVARLNANKGHRFALQAIARLRDEGIHVAYQIIGGGDYRARLEEEIGALGLGEQVTLTGPLGQDRVLALLKSADALALTSIGKGEAAPVAVMEAMACGLPVVCSRIGGTADMITDGEDGLLVDQQDVDGITEALRLLATDPAAAARIGAAARARAERDFDDRALARRLSDEIAAAIAPPTCRTSPGTPRWAR